MKSSSKKFLSVAVSVLLITYVVYNIFNLVYKPVKTEQAMKTRVDDSLVVSGIAIRSEMLVDLPEDGITDYLVSDGEKVAKGEKIANVYSSASGADVEERLRATEAEIARVEAALGARGSGVDVYALEDNIRAKLSAFAGVCREGRLVNADGVMNDVLSGFNMRQVVQGDVSGFEARLDELKKEYSELKSSRTGDFKSVSSPDAGFFVCYTDSLEDATDYNSVKTLTPAQIKELLEMKPTLSSEGKGKVINEYEWYYAALISPENAARISVGKMYPVSFSSFLSYDVYFTVEKIEADADGNNAVVFSCNNVNKELACMRNDVATVKINTYSGIPIKPEALRVVNGVQGVYIARGQRVAFRRIEPVYTADGYVISKINRNDPDYLQVYDNIIIGGKDIYEGKLI